MKPYRIEVFYSKEDQAWVANVPDLRYCSALGQTPHEAVAQVEEASEAWIEAALASGSPVPEPGELHPQYA